MEVFATMVYCWCRPFIENKDNILGVLTNFLVLLVMLTALLLKHNNKEENDAEEGIGGFLIFMNVLCVVVFVVFGVAQAYSYKHDFDNDAKTTKGLALGTLTRQATGDDIEEGRGRGSSLFAAGKGWLERISSGAVDLAGEVFYSEARRKEREAGVPGFAGPVDNSDLPQAPAGAPGPNNSIFDIMKQQSLHEGGIEMAENPMLKNIDEKGKKGLKKKSDEGEGRLRAPSKQK
jgi:hypothetical protein